ncbi:MAG: hypothetical protein ACHQ1H_03200 [Nitrososphaerales archaeon]
MSIFSRKKKDSTGEAPKDDYFLGQSEYFQWRAQAGLGSVSGVDWIRRDAIPFLEKVYSVYKSEILQLGEANRLPIRVSVRPSFECKGGIGGATGSGELSYCAGEWNANQYCYGIISHELCNLLTGEKVTAGWPTEWWANHRSPFPTMIANQALRKVVPQYYRAWGDYNDPLVVMFEQLYNDFPGMFPKMFAKMRELRVSLQNVEDPRLSHTVYYFMFYGAGRQLVNYFVVPPMPPINPRIISDLESTYRLHVV